MINYVYNDFFLDIARGRIRKHSHRFWSMGERQAVAVTATGDDAWRGTATTTPVPDQTTGEQMTLVSTSAEDGVAGTGVTSVRIHYLDGNWEQQEEMITLDGLTPVDTVATDIKFINVLHAESVGTNGVAVGDITIYKKGAASTVYTLLAVGGNMHLTSSRMVPAGKTLYLTRWSASSTAGKPMFIRIRSTDFNGNLYNGGAPVFLFKDVINAESATYSKEFSCLVDIPAKSVIKVSAWATAIGGNISCSFEGILVDE